MMPIGFKYVWFMWSSAFMLAWLTLYALAPGVCRIMLRASVPTAAFGLTEPIFVPAYWNPSSLFDLAQRAGFDIESLTFCFAIGGIGAAGYRALSVAPESVMSDVERQSGRHRWHLLALISPFPIFLLLLWFPWNPIYPSLVALFSGALAAAVCRPDLVRNSVLGDVIFFGLYLVFLMGLHWTWPGYIEAVWNLPDLLPWRPFGLPLEEILFGFGFGLYWSCVYEHVGWRHGSFRLVALDFGPSRAPTSGVSKPPL